jgi:hypothetical protein
MSSIKTFTVFGDRVKVFVDSAMSNGLSSTLVQEVHPGGGLPLTATRKRMRLSSFLMVTLNS